MLGNGSAIHTFAERMAGTALTTIIPRYFFGLWLSMNTMGRMFSEKPKPFYIFF
jgi:hypothetical protein